QLRNDLPASLPPVLRTMMAKKPQDRYQTPAALAQSLSVLLQMSPGQGALVPTAKPQTALATVNSPYAMPVPVNAVRVRDGRLGRALQALRLVLQRLAPARGGPQEYRRRIVLVGLGSAL